MQQQAAIWLVGLTGAGRVLSAYTTHAEPQPARRPKPLDRYSVSPGTRRTTSAVGVAQ
jgi:hypothetical protein